jgi:metal-sulfur cluster biosynthetic enzyme
MVKKAEIMAELAKVIDPEIGVPITEMGLVDAVKVRAGKVLVEFHLTMPFCPPMFAMQIGKDIRTRISKIRGVKEVKISLKDHYMADYINREVNK